LIHEDNGFFDQAIYHFNRSLEILRELEDTQKVIMILNNLGNIYYLIKDLEHSYEFYQEALQISEEENFIFEEIKSSSNLVEVLYLLKDYDRINRILDRNILFFKENEDLYGTVQTQIKYGKLYFFQGEDYDLAYESFSNALKLIEEVKKTVSIYVKAKLEWECFLYLGKLHLIWNNLVDAEDLFLKSLEAVRIFGIKDNINEGKILEELGNLYSQKEVEKRAIEYYELSYDIFYKYGDNVKCAELKYIIAQLYFESERNESTALRYFEDALTLYESLEHFKEAAILLHKLGDYYIHKGMVDMAIPNFKRAIEYFKDLRDYDSINLIKEKIISISEDKHD
jgi:tetratricopeptide (TPR) repeat protein